MLRLEHRVGASDGSPRYQVGVRVAHAGCQWPVPGAGDPHRVPVTHAGCRWRTPGAGAEGCCVGWWWLPGSNGPLQGNEAAFNPILPTWPRPQEEP